MWLTRRTLLSGIALSSLSCALFTSNQFAQVNAAASASVAYRGNPDAVVTAIDTSSGIACSRTSGQTPCFVQVSASAISATGSIPNSGLEFNPYEDLSYEWDFGDPNGAEVFTDPRPFGAGLVNANVDQRGPEAAYVYRSPGEYKITLTIYGKNGSNFVKSVATQQVIVKEFNASSGTYYFDSNGGDDRNNGLSPEKPKRSIAALNAISTVGNRAIYLKRNSRWIGTLFPGQRSRIAAYGSGADPVFLNNKPDEDCMRIRAYREPRDDLVISNIACIKDLTGTGVIAGAFAGDYPYSNIYFDRCTFTRNEHGGGIGIQYANAEIANSGVWGCSVNRPLTTTPARNGVGFYSGAKYWSFIVGCSFAGAGGHPVLDHHIYPQTKEHSLYRWLSFTGGDSLNFCINTNYDRPRDATELEYAQFILMDGINFTGTARAFDASDGRNDPSRVRFKNFVVQNCAMHDLRAAPVWFACGESMTIRNCDLWNCGVYDYISLAGDKSVLVLKFYKNRIYRGAGNESSNEPLLKYRNGWRKAQQLVDNAVVDLRAAANIISLAPREHVDNGSLIARNQYWAPNDRDGKFFDESFVAARSFVEWQALGFDVGGRVGDPRWRDPAKGDFGRES